MLKGSMESGNCMNLTCSDPIKKSGGLLGAARRLFKCAAAKREPGPERFPKNRRHSRQNGVGSWTAKRGTESAAWEPVYRQSAAYTIGTKPASRSWISFAPRFALALYCFGHVGRPALRA